VFIHRTEEDNPTDLEKLITDHISAIASMMEGSEEHTNAANSLKTLMEAYKLEEEMVTSLSKPWWQPSGDQLVAAGTAFGTVAVILAFEMRNVITSKAASFVPKIRI